MSRTISPSLLYRPLLAASRLARPLQTRSFQPSSSPVASSSSSPSCSSSSRLPLVGSFLSPLRLFSTTPSTPTWGGGKLKTHQGTAKRVRAISKKRTRAPKLANSLLALGHSPEYVASRFTATPYGSPENVKIKLGTRAGGRPGPLFKMGRTGKRHLNAGVSGGKLNKMGGTKVIGQGRIGWKLRKLLAPIL